MDRARTLNRRLAKHVHIFENEEQPEDEDEEHADYQPTRDELLDALHRGLYREAVLVATEVVLFAIEEIGRDETYRQHDVPIVDEDFRVHPSAHLESMTSVPMYETIPGRHVVTAAVSHKTVV